MNIPQEELFRIERTLSKALQPEESALRRVKAIAWARDYLRRLMRDAGYKGQF